MSKRGERMQAEVLAVLREQRCPLSAYQLLDALRAANPKIAPPTIYRALAALLDRGLVHRIESLNAFFACQSGLHETASVLSICGDCGAVEETVAPGPVQDLSNVVGRSGFAPARHVIEFHGTCGPCGRAQPRSL